MLEEKTSKSPKHLYFENWKLYVLLSGFGILLIICMLGSTRFLDKLPTITATFLTVLALFITCVYTVRNSAENGMHNTIDNFYIYANEDTKKTAKGKLQKELQEEVDAWKDLYVKNTAVTTHWLYSFLVLASAFLVSISFDKNAFLVSIYLNRNCIIFLLLVISMASFLKGFDCHLLNYKEISGKEIPGKQSWFTQLSKLIFKKGFLGYKCPIGSRRSKFLSDIGIELKKSDCSKELD